MEVTVQTFQERINYTLLVPLRCTVKPLRELLCKEIGLKPEAALLFGLFLGNPGTPVKLLEDEEEVPAQEPLCFQRWCFDMKLEAKVTRHDDAAVHLLYNECQHYLRSGRVRPSPGQAQELDELSDPIFPTERQFLERARGVDGYSEFAANECKVLTGVRSNTYSVQQGDTVCCSAGWDVLLVWNSSLRAEWPWTAVRAWNMPAFTRIQFEVCVHMQNAPVMRWLSLETIQAPFLHRGATTICRTKAGQLPPSVRPPHDIKQTVSSHQTDRLFGFLNTHFDAKQFTSIEND